MAKKILVIDDDANIVQMLDKRLSASGYDVIHAGTGLEAIPKVKAEQPDLIILDIMMPDLDGTETARILKEDEKAREIPIIYLTALKDPNDDTFQSQFGPNIVMGKPFNAEELLVRIKDLLASR